MKEPDYVNLRHMKQLVLSLANARQEPQRPSPEQTVQRQNSSTYENMLRRDYMGPNSDEHKQQSDMYSHSYRSKGRSLSSNYLLLKLHTMMSIEPLPSMETPAVMPKGPVAVASDNPSYTLEVGNIFDL